MYPPELERKTTDMGWGEPDQVFTYTSLPEPLLSAELARLADVRTHADTDTVSIQPCPNPAEASQDRVVVQDWPLWGGTWAFRAVFDGHIGHDTVNHAAAHLPACVRTALEGLAPLGDGAPPPVPATIEAALRGAVVAFDQAIGDAVRALFPDEGELGKMSVATVLARLDALDAKGEEGRAKVWRALRGSTVLVVLVDPGRENVWVVSLGDCAAVLGTKKGGEWTAQVLSYAHNGENVVEADRVRAAHPGEECIIRDRVLGIIAVTRALGDFPFKLPPVYTERLFIPAGECDADMARKMQEQASRNKSAPYLSGEPQTRHVHLRRRRATGEGQGEGDGEKEGREGEGAEEALLVMCSDGLGDLSPDRMKHEVLALQWVRAAAAGGTATATTMQEGKGNAALAVLRDALGGDDLEVVSRNLTVEMPTRWMDDTTVLVQKLF